MPHCSDLPFFRGGGSVAGNDAPATEARFPRAPGPLTALPPCAFPGLERQPDPGCGGERRVLTWGDTRELEKVPIVFQVDRCSLSGSCFVLFS